jgi:2',3'-cyclic-nucleotide 2'-phosphodiesterase/3'-nucleotidase
MTVAAGQVTLRILSTTDLHAHIRAYDYFRDEPVETCGLTRVASLIRAARAEVPNCLLVDNGDLIQGTPLGDFMAEDTPGPQRRPHPMIAALNQLNYDAATLGNHDFNFGLDHLLHSIADAEFPYVLTNAVRDLGDDPLRDAPFLPPSTILERDFLDSAGARHRIRLGVIGLTPPQITSWDQTHLAGHLQTRDMLEAARAHARRLREEGADLVLALAHTGLVPPDAPYKPDTAALPLAQLDDIDVVIAGHVHKVFPAPASHHGDACCACKPIVMAGAQGSHLGVVDLVLEHDGARWAPVQSRADTRPISTRAASGRIKPLVGDDPEILAVTEAAHQATLAHIRADVGRCTTPLHSYFSLVTGSSHLTLLAEAERWHVTRMLQDQPEADLPLLTAVAPYRFGGSGGAHNFTEVAAGPLLLRNISDLYHYPNQLRVVEITGAQLRSWLERSAGVYRQIAPGAQDAALFDQEFPSYFCDILFGVSYQIDLSSPSRFDIIGNLMNPSAYRIRDLRFDGQPVRDDARFLVSTNNYRTGGGGGFCGAQQGRIVLETCQNNRDLLCDYVRAQEVVSPEPQAHWHFAPMPGTTVRFDTGPRANLYESDLAGLSCADLGLQEDGFRAYRLAL